MYGREVYYYIGACKIVFKISFKLLRIYSTFCKNQKA